MRAETITSANARLVDCRQTLPLAQIWVEEKWHLQMECALLRQSETINAGPNRKYFGNNRGITGTTFVSGSVFRLSWHRYTGDAEGLYLLCWKVFWNRSIGLNPTEIMTDTAGASELVLWPFLAAGIHSFLHARADAGASVFWRMDHDADYGVLNDIIARGQSDPRKIGHCCK
ncbi:Tn3 family transposase [Escherichia coli]|uniref:Tn3 family transposase n=1 Tax=Escherichia coli TaxID=562 RepID=UPI0038905607